MNAVMYTAISCIVVTSELQGVDSTTCEEISVHIYRRLLGFKDPENSGAHYDYIDLGGF